MTEYTTHRASPICGWSRILGLDFWNRWSVSKQTESLPLTLNFICETHRPRLTDLECDYYHQLRMYGSEVGLVAAWTPGHRWLRRTNQNPYTDEPSCWKEVSIFWRRPEILLTGGIGGTWDTNDVTAYFTPSVLFIVSPDGDIQTKDIRNAGLIEHINKERCLRTYANKYASLKWANISQALRWTLILYMSQERNRPVSSWYRFYAASLYEKCFCSNDYYTASKMLLKTLDGIKQLPAEHQAR